MNHSNNLREKITSVLLPPRGIYKFGYHADKIRLNLNKDRTKSPFAIAANAFPRDGENGLKAYAIHPAMVKCRVLSLRWCHTFDESLFYKADILAPAQSHINGRRNTSHTLTSPAARSAAPRSCSAGCGGPIMPYYIKSGSFTTRYFHSGHGNHFKLGILLFSLCSDVFKFDGNRIFNPGLTALGTDKRRNISHNYDTGCQVNRERCSTCFHFSTTHGTLGWNMLHIIFFLS